MSSPGKTIARRPWLLPLLAVIFLVQMQQSMACGLMKLPAVNPDEYCAMHMHGVQDDSQATPQFCCDDVISNTAGYPCHLEQEVAASSSLLGKLQPDWQPVFMIISHQDTFDHSYPPLLTIMPDRELPWPGIPHYLATQRLRI